MEIIWSQRALRHLEAVACYIACDAPRRASTFVDRLIAATDQLALHPLSGSKCRIAPTLRQLVISRYRVIYRVRENIEILSVLSPRQSGRRT